MSFHLQTGQTYYSPLTPGYHAYLLMAWCPPPDNSARVASGRYQLGSVHCRQSLVWVERKRALKIIEGASKIFKLALECSKRLKFVALFAARWCSDYHVRSRAGSYGNG